MDDVVARYASRPAPRYTSYPTAPHFKAGFAEETYRAWLAALNPQEPISLYLHVPFCREMCWYCGCNMKLVKREEPLAAYAQSLMEEITLLAEALPARMKIAHLHWGGGTPTALTLDQITRLSEHLEAHFEILPKAERAIESDPRTLSEEMVIRLAALGFNRASFGVQEFDPKVQAAINRIQPPQMVADAVQMFRTHGIRAINFDLIYGLPYQTSENLTRTMELVAEMAPNRIALFGYAHVPWMAKNQRMIPDDALPGTKARAEQAQAAARAITEAGYHRIGIDHFARPDDRLTAAAREGRLSRNFQGYTDDPAPTLLGLGATSIGRCPQGYVQNLSETGAWARMIASGQLPVGKGLAFQGDDLLRAAVIERIMCDGAVDLPQIMARFNAPQQSFEEALLALEPLIADGLVWHQCGRIALTERGAPLARVVASCFDSYLHHSEARHSVAV